VAWLRWNGSRYIPHFRPLQGLFVLIASVGWDLCFTRRRPTAVKGAGIVYLGNTFVLRSNLCSSLSTRPVRAQTLGDGLFKILPTANYEPGDEGWEFPPGSRVRAEKRVDAKGELLLAGQA
jgi:hypothetical protein